MAARLMTLSALAALAAAAALPPALGLGVAPAPVPAPPFSGCVTTEAELKEAAAQGGRYCVDGLVAISSFQTSVEKDLELYSESGVAGEDGFVGLGDSIGLPTQLLVADGPVSLLLEGLTMNSFQNDVSVSGNASAALINCTLSQNNGASQAYGPAIVADGFNSQNTSVLVQGCTFFNNTVGFTQPRTGAAISASWGASVTVKDSLFEAQTAGIDDYGFGGAIAISAGATLDVQNSTFRGCAATNGGSGGAIVVTGDVFPPLTVATIVDTLFEANIAEAAGSVAQGGAIYAQGFAANVSVSRSTFIHNTAGLDRLDGNAGYGGAIACDVLSTVNVSESDFKHNKAQAQGGAIWSASSTPMAIEDSTFANNTSVQQNGGALYSGGGQQMSVSNCSFTNNTSPHPSGGTGAAIFVTSQANVSISDSSFTANAAGGAYGAIVMQSAFTQLRVEDCSFEGNTAATTTATAIFSAEGNFSGEVCGSANDFANEPVPQTTVPSPLPPCA